MTTVPATAGTPLRELHRDARLLAVDKPAGLLVHRTALDAHEVDTVLLRLQHQTGERLWPVHRLDKGTSGVLVLARDPERPSTGQDTRDASTRYRCRARFDWPFQVDARHPSSRYALVDAWPDTGRRHQIRRHFKHIGHPVVGDSTHGKGAHNRAVAAWLGVSRLWLHAASICLPHPDGQLPLTIDAEPGAEWQALLPGAALASRP